MSLCSSSVVEENRGIFLFVCLFVFRFSHPGHFARFLAAAVFALHVSILVHVLLRFFALQKSL